MPVAIGGPGLPEGLVLRDDLPDAGLANIPAACGLTHFVRGVGVYVSGCGFWNVGTCLWTGAKLVL